MLTDLDPSVLDRLLASLRAGEYNLLLGAGVSFGAKGGDGKDLPSGDAFRSELCALKKAKPSTSLQRVFELLDDTEIETLVTKRFRNCVPNNPTNLIPTFVWRRIFTLNVDDALEEAYKGAPLQHIKIKNFGDPYEDSAGLGEIPVVHLHGFSGRPEDGYVFSRSAYIQRIRSGSAWSVILADIIAVEPFFIVGTALDEVDIDFYLSKRSQVSTRSDRGPGIFIEPFPDAVTIKDCEKHDLILYQGTAEQFFNELDALVRDRRPPIEILSESGASIFPEGTDKLGIARFLSDFEIVRPIAEPDEPTARFYLGHKPSWSDLQRRLDIPRDVTADAKSIVRRNLEDSSRPIMLFIPDSTGGGKSTMLKRVAYDLACEGKLVINCSALSRLEPTSTSALIDLIDQDLVICVDDLADQAGPIGDIIDSIEKRNAIFVACEREYRRQYLDRVLAGVDCDIVKPQGLSAREARQLISTYSSAGLTNVAGIVSSPEKFVKRLQNEPIAIAACRILGNFQPLERIVESLIKDATKFDLERYLVSAIAQFCINGGVRHDILVAASSGGGLRKQLTDESALALAYSDDLGRNYVVPMNGVLASVFLERAKENYSDLLFEAFVKLGSVLSPRVNRFAIKRRTPEARLAGRLFDFDQVTEPFLGERSEEFYKLMQEQWQWNSRYWEQFSLLKLEEFIRSGKTNQTLMTTASYHARHAVSLETHPFPLTTLGKVLIAEFEGSQFSNRAVFDEALQRLGQAIDMEQKWRWRSTQAYHVALKGALLLLSNHGRLSPKQAEEIRGYVSYCRLRFKHDADLMSQCDLFEEVSAL